jgi:hypothetical protein
MVATIGLLAAGCGGNSSTKRNATTTVKSRGLITAPGTKSPGTQLASKKLLSGKPSIVLVSAGKPLEYTYQLSTKSVKRGIVIFKVTNFGKLRHGFQVGGRQTKSLFPGDTTRLRVIFVNPGSYSYRCLQPAIVKDDPPAPPPCGGGILTVT